MAGKRKADLARQFLRAAEKRLLAAKALAAEVHHAEFGIEAIYLAGYGVECALKSLLISRTPTSHVNELIDRISKGSRGHNFDFLRYELQLTGWMQLSTTLRPALAGVVTWHTGLRYSSERKPSYEVRMFLSAAQTIYDAVRRSGDF